MPLATEEDRFTWLRISPFLVPLRVGIVRTTFEPKALAIIPNKTKTQVRY